MKKLERLNERLFKEIECSQISNLASVSGGEIVATCESRSVYVPVTKSYVTNWYTDRRAGHMTKSGWVWDEPAKWGLADSCGFTTDTSPSTDSFSTNTSISTPSYKTLF